MQIFYTPDINGVEYTLSEDESKHAIRVLRMELGSPMYLVDGKGNFYEGIIADAHPKRCKILVQNVITDYGKRNYKLHIAISPLKNPDRFEWFLEKAVEIGIDTITPIMCERTEKKNLNIDRCYRIAESAIKQSIKAFRPQINDFTKFSDLVSQTNEPIKLIAACEGERKLIRDCYSKGNEVIILVGPEGDFSPQEVALATEKGFSTVSLGESRLRTETAGIAVCHSISFLNL